MGYRDELFAVMERGAAAQGLDLRELDIGQFLAGMDDATIEALLAPIQEEEQFLRFNKFKLFFPDETVEKGGVTFHSRHQYPKHMEFFADGAEFRERLFMAANRVGKTIAGAYEVSAHLTGQYPHWWPGYRFKKEIRAWAAGDTNETTRDIIQLELLGNVIGGLDGRKGVDGSGMIPRECIGPIKWKQGVQDLVDTVGIKHKGGRLSWLAFKSYDQGRRSFQGTAKEVIWLDEECPVDVYGECLIRVATTRGLLLTTFTPLTGLTELVLSFLNDSERPAA